MNSEEFEDYIADAQMRDKLKELETELGVVLLEDPWRHLDALRRVGYDAFHALSPETRAEFEESIAGVMSVVQGFDIDVSDPVAVRAFLVGVGFSWRLVSDEFRRCTATTQHQLDHVNAALTRLFIAAEPYVLNLGVRPPAAE